MPVYPVICVCGLSTFVHVSTKFYFTAQPLAGLQIDRKRRIALQVLRHLHWRGSPAHLRPCRPVVRLNARQPVSWFGCPDARFHARFATLRTYSCPLFVHYNHAHVG